MARVPTSTRPHRVSDQVTSAPNTRAGGKGPNVLDVADLTVQFGGLRAVDTVSLAVPEQGFVGLIGPNGAGKTTFLNAVNGFLTPRSGTIHLLGADITRKAAAARARLGIGRCFQSVGLDKRETTRENLRIALEVGSFAKEMLFLALGARERLVPRHQQQVDDIIELLGLEPVLGKRVADLPVGSAKLVEIASVLLRRPRLLLLDEPSAGLTSREADQLMEALHSILRSERVSILMIDHDMRMTMRAVDYLYVLSFGKLLAEGPPEEVGKDPAVIEAYLGRGHSKGTRER